jgi:hypothetical protein
MNNVANPASTATLQQQIEEAKQSLSAAQDAYVHAFARGDWAQCSTSKKQCDKCFKELQALIKKKLALAKP